MSRKEEGVAMFENEETAVIVKEKLLPVLEELARAEFGAYSITGNIDGESIRWMRKGGQALLEVIAAYLMGLMNAHIKTGQAVQRSEGGGSNEL